MLAVHNLAGRDCVTRLDPAPFDGARVIELGGDHLYDACEGGEVELRVFGYRWFRIDAGERG